MWGSSRWNGERQEGGSITQAWKLIINSSYINDLAKSQRERERERENLRVGRRLETVFCNRGWEWYVGGRS
jgi:hypothetical protein